MDIIVLSDSTGFSVYTCLKTLQELEEKGLVVARRLRLTLQGVSVALKLEAAESGRWTKSRVAAQEALHPLRAA